MGLRIEKWLDTNPLRKRRKFYIVKSVGIRERLGVKMQTFLPYSDFVLSAKALDYRRLGKQRVEAKQLLSAIGGLGGWQKHPACDMWRNSIDALKYYHDVMIDEWMSRGYNNNMPKFGMADLHNKGLVIMPSWLGDPDFHASHRSNLLRKDPVFYGKHGWLEPNNLPYIWPKS